ncbi:MAG: DegT/DnrJ/EryC1/StrS family aminotransferase, partial [Bacteroidia bacterium]|nr:DegT/DnrJ/EryC1/StrS family aminotransferase [Bacteroidia bacterium]NNM16287.1 DegT/DnrJ/EryC1/StrS family aminotransferase [Bacteroidia bacterium]
MKIFLSRPNIGEEEIKAVTEVLKTDQLALGPKAELFEKLFASLTNTKYAVAVNSGTSGLHLAVRALDIKDGDEVITTPFSFIASANCMLFEKAIPVFVDVEEETYGMNPDLIEAAITPRTKAILPVHVFGQCCKMDEIEKIAKKHNLKIIEDACESPLATHNNRQAGSFGDCSVFAFYPNKQMTTGEGGMITTNDEALYNLFLSLRNQGRGNSLEWLTHTRLGYNYRISEISAAIGVEQTKKLPRFIEEKRELANKYNFVLGNINGLTTPITGKSNTHSWFVYSVR